MTHNDYTAAKLEMALMPRAVRYLPSVGSTNDIAHEWLAAGAPAGSVVVADEQTAGRGRHGRTWYTPPGVALALSVIVRPTSPGHIPGVNMAGTLAVQQTLHTLNLTDVRIKWANDLLVSGKKISGVLPEIVWDGDDLSGVILGIGVNVRNTFTETPLDGLATTVEAEAGRPVDRVNLLAVLLFQLDIWLDKLGTAPLLAAYRQGAAHMLGAPVRVNGADGETRGTALDIERDGALVVRTEAGTLTRIYAGDITGSGG